MQVSQTNADGLTKAFKVVIPAAQLAAKTEARLHEVGQTVRIPGFRPGKVPAAILRKKYGPSIFGEVVEETVKDGIQQALEEYKIRPAVQPKVEITSYQEGGDLEFTIAVESLPEVEITDLTALVLEKPVAAVDEAVVEKALQDVAAQRNSTEDAGAEHAAEDGNVLVIDFLGKLDGVPFEGGKADGYKLKLGSNTFIPGFEDQLLGAKAGEDRLVKVTFPADYTSEALAGKEAEFEVKVHEVRQVVPAAIDDALAETLGLDNLAALRQALRDEIEKDYASLSRGHLKRALLDRLAALHDFPVPAGMVDSEFESIWKQVQEDKDAGRQDAVDAGKSDEVLQADYRGIAERRVRLGLLLAEIGRQNTVSISQEDLQRAVLTEARRFPGQEHLVFQYYQKNPQAMDSLRAPVFEEKVVDFVLEKATVTEKPVSVEDLHKDPDGAPEPLDAGASEADAGVAAN